MLREGFGREDPGRLQDDQALALFIESIAPQFAQWLEKGITGEASIASAVFDDVSARVARTIPAPVFPQPSVLILGRLWFLKEGDSPSKLFVLADGQKLPVSGDFISTYSLTKQWQEIAISRLQLEFGRCQPSYGRGSRGFAAALQRFRSLGVHEAEHLLLLAGSPMLLGHILPNHYNYLLQRASVRDLAVCAPLVTPLTLPRGVGTLRIFRREGRCWHQLSLAHGTCLGAAPETSGLQQIRDPVLRLAIFLRFAANRFALNGRFHEAEAT